ncbi:MAG: endonuclease V [Candidatus Aureabacteria bacterium]|nr:endonuclease V [Candidatus Auribacterota bacterium]
MKPEIRHSFNLSFREAAELQKKLSAKISMPRKTKTVGTVCGVDVSYSLKTSLFFAGAVVLSFPGMEILSSVTAKGTVSFPYVPGFLSFREIPVLRKCLLRLGRKPDVIMVDGQGIAHPRKFGLASHIGVTYNIPSIGCAKSLLVGEFNEPGTKKGSKSPIIYKGEQVGCALRTKDNVKPVFISVGNLISLRDALNIALISAKRYRIPEPTRQAHMLVNNFRKNHEK